jgi:hypothetical protein
MTPMPIECLARLASIFCLSSRLAPFNAPLDGWLRISDFDGISLEVDFVDGIPVPESTFLLWVTAAGLAGWRCRHHAAR